MNAVTRTLSAGGFLETTERVGRNHEWHHADWGLTADSINPFTLLWGTEHYFIVVRTNERNGGFATLLLSVTYCSSGIW